MVSAIACLVALIVLAASGIWYTNHVQRESDRRWCELMATLDDANQQPPVTEYGKKLAAEIHVMRRNLGCEE